MKLELKKSLYLCFLITLIIIGLTQFNIFEYSKNILQNGDEIDPVKEFDGVDNENNLNKNIIDESDMILNHIYYKSRGIDKLPDDQSEPKIFKDQVEQSHYTRIKFAESRKKHKLNKEFDRMVRSYLYSEYNDQSKFIIDENSGKEILVSELKDNLVGYPLDIVKNSTELNSIDQGWKKDVNRNKLLLVPPIIFIHNPKTAGTTLKKILLKNVDLPTYYHRDAHPSMGDRDILLESKFLFGHFRFGLHYYYDMYYNSNPMNKSENRIEKYIEPRQDRMNPYSYLAFFRDPVERVWSHYYFLKESITHPFHRQTIKLTFQGWVLRSPIAHNEMCRRLVGLSREDHYPGDFKEQCLFRLKHSLKFVGITERFNETLVLLTHYLGFTDISYKNENVGSLKQTYQLSEEDRILIEKYNEVDIEMYKEAKKIFEKQIDQVGRDYFNEELKRFNN